jgi:hypothetical protein
MTTKAATLECMQDTQDFLNEEHEIGMERNRKFQPQNEGRKWRQRERTRYPVHEKC